MEQGRHLPGAGPARGQVGGAGPQEVTTTSPRKYYSPLAGYLGQYLLQYGEALHHLARGQEAKTAVQVTRPVVQPQLNGYRFVTEAYLDLASNCTR